MHAWQAIVLGVVEGVTEYLPISSTGHLILAQRALGIANDEAARAFAICIQSGAILAVLSLYWPRVRQMFKGLAGRDRAGLRLCILIVAAFMPAAILGVVFKKRIEAHLFGLWPIVVAWALGGVAILCVKKLRTPQHVGRELPDLSVGIAVVIGCAQALALAPGTSRSLVTIGAGLLLGLSSASAVEFSLLLGVVTLLGATVKEAHDAGGAMLHEFGAANIALGTLAAFVSAFLAVKWLVTWLRSHGLSAFGYYRIALALLVVLLLTRHLIDAG